LASLSWENVGSSAACLVQCACGVPYMLDDPGINSKKFQKYCQILYEGLVVARNVDTSFLTYFHILFISSQTWLNPLCGYYMIATWATSQNWKRTKHRLREWKTQL
jgi:hypothetical protein